MPLISLTLQKFKSIITEFSSKNCCSKNNYTEKESELNLFYDKFEFNPLQICVKPKFLKKNRCNKN